MKIQSFFKKLVRSDSIAKSYTTNIIKNIVCVSFLFHKTQLIRQNCFSRYLQNGSTDPFKILIIYIKYQYLVRGQRNF